MPLLHIRSLRPAATKWDVAAVVENISRDFAEGVGVALEHVTTTWDFFVPGGYAVGGRAATEQPEDSHPVLVDLLAPDFNSAKDVEKMLRAAATSIARRAKISRRNIFITFRAARSGMVFDQGDIVRW